MHGRFSIALTEIILEFQKAGDQTTLSETPIFMVFCEIAFYRNLVELI